MTEKLLQFIWQFQYFNRSALQTTTGEAVEIIAPGKLNSNQGPDFLDARIRVGRTLFAGAVELHLKTSDWNKHGHQEDSNYQTVVLHVVLQHDELFQNPIPVLELHTRIATPLLHQYQQLMHEVAFIPCATTIAQTREIIWMSWKERLVAERLTRKAAGIFTIWQQTNNNWEETFWRALARNFGATVNSDAFEELARSLPVTLLAKQRHNRVQIEALLLGGANLLLNDAEDNYTQLLQQEYKFLRAKYNVKPISTAIHFLRMRPHNFPTIRLAQLAMLIFKTEHLFSKMLDEMDVLKAKKSLQVTASEYWNEHYQLGKPSPFKPKNIGSNMADLLLINTIIPLLFAYGMHHTNEVQKEKAIAWLQQLAAEPNTITAAFKELAVPAKTAYDSQALLELKRAYCDTRRCLQCAVGASLLKRLH